MAARNALIWPQIAAPAALFGAGDDGRPGVAPLHAAPKKLQASPPRLSGEFSRGHRVKTSPLWNRYAGVLLVVALHAAALWGLWSYRLRVPVQEAVTVFVDFIAPPVAQRVAAAPKRELPPQPRPEEKPQARQPVTAAPIVPIVPIVPAVPVAEVAVAPAPTSAIRVPVESRPSASAGPVTLAAELSASCPERSAPNYPLPSRRMGETGTALLRVELDEQGQVVAAGVATGSGFARLDEAALSAVKTWRCTPAQRDGRPVRAVALQPFKFVLEGN